MQIINCDELDRQAINRGLDYKALARAAGLHEMTLYNIRRGKAARIGTVIKLARALGCDAGLLLKER